MGDMDEEKVIKALSSIKCQKAALDRALEGDMDEDKVIKDRALEILNIMSYFEPGIVPISMFRYLVSNEAELEHAIDLLKHNLLVDSVEDNSTVLSINKVVQETIRKNLKEQNQEENTLKKAVKLFEAQDKVNISTVNHAKFIWKYLYESQILIENACWLPNYIVNCLGTNGMYEEADILGTKAFDLLKRLIGDNHPEVITLQHNKAKLLSYQGKLKEALEVLWPLYKKYMNLPEQREIICTLISISKEFIQLSEFEQASQICAKLVSDSQQSKVGKNHEAFVKYKETAKCIKQVLGEKHPHSLDTQANLAAIFASRGEHQKALDIFYDVYKIKVEVLGEKSCDTLKMKHNIASIQMLQGNHEGNYCDAIKTFEEVLIGYSEVLGPHNQDTVVIKNIIYQLKLKQKSSSRGSSIQNSISTPLHHAVNNGNKEDLIALLKKGADITEVTSKKGNTALHIAVSKGDNEMVKILSQHAKQLSPTKLNDFINAKTSTKCTTALHISAGKGNLYMTKLLLQNGAIYNANNKENKTPSLLTTDNAIKDILDLVEVLFKDVRRGNNQQIAEHIKKEKAIVNARDNNGGGTPLYWAIHNDRVDTTKLLLQKGASPAFVTSKGNTPLHIASLRGNNEIVGILIDKINSDKLNDFINAQTTAGGTTALHIASNIEVVKSLLRYGAIYNIKNKEGKTPLNLTKSENIRNLLALTDELFENTKYCNDEVISRQANLEADEFAAITNARNEQGHTLLQLATTSKAKEL